MRSFSNKLAVQFKELDSIFQYDNAVRCGFKWIEGKTSIVKPFSSDLLLVIKVYT